MRYKTLCGYIRQRWDCGDTVEIEEKHTGKYGARGQTRQKRRKATPEEIAKHNQWKRERDVRRLIKWNFRERDYWITLTYPKGYKPTWEEMKDHAGKLVRKIREKYKKQGWILKYIYRLAIGSRGGRHIHILINRETNEKTATDLIITDVGTAVGARTCQFPHALQRGWIQTACHLYHKTPGEVGVRRA